MRGTTMCVCVVVAILSETGAVNAVTIDFGPGLPGAPVAGSVMLTDQLAGLGVTFSSPDPNGVVWHSPTSSEFAPYSITPGVVGSPPHLLAPIRMDFAPFVGHVAIRGFDGGFDIDTLMLKAYDESGVEVDSTELIDVFATPGLIAMVSAPAIAYTIMQASSALEAGLFFDDLEFEPVPEPSLVAVASTGVLVMLGLVRRRTSRRIRW